MEGRRGSRSSTPDDGAAGVYMVTRPSAVRAGPGVLTLSLVGAFTALLARRWRARRRHQARLGLDRLAARLYDAAAAPRRAAGFLHLLTHGLFKALLFLAAGAVIHASDNDIFRMAACSGDAQTGSVHRGTLALAGAAAAASSRRKPCRGGGRRISRAVPDAGAHGVNDRSTCSASSSSTFSAAPTRRPSARGAVVMRGPLWLLAALTLVVGSGWRSGVRWERRRPGCSSRSAGPPGCARLGMYQRGR